MVIGRMFDHVKLFQSVTSVPVQHEYPLGIIKPLYCGKCQILATVVPAPTAIQAAEAQ